MPDLVYLDTTPPPELSLLAVYAHAHDTNAGPRLAHRHASYGRPNSLPPQHQAPGAQVIPPPSAALSLSGPWGGEQLKGAEGMYENNIQPSITPAGPSASSEGQYGPTAPLRELRTPLYPSYDVPRLPSASTLSSHRHRISPERIPIPPPHDLASIPRPKPPSPKPYTPSLSIHNPYRPLHPIRPTLQQNHSFASDDTGPEETPAPGTETQTAFSGRAGAKRKYKYKRTRTGCMCCRKRRIKCDEGKPTCDKCVKAKREVECEYEDDPSQNSSTGGDSGEEGLALLATSPPPKPPPLPKKRSKRGKLPTVPPPQSAPSAPAIPAKGTSSLQNGSRLQDLPEPTGYHQETAGLECREEWSNQLTPASALPQVGGTANALGLDTLDLDFPFDETFVPGYQDNTPGAISPDPGPSNTFTASSDMGQVSQAWGGAGSAPMLSTPNFLLPWFPTSEERNLILHYCANAADLMMAIPSGLNPMLAINLPLALDSPRGTNPASDALRTALLGIGAVHQAFLLARSGMSTAGTFEYAASLRSAGKALVRIAAADPVASRSDATLGAATSLALIDMLFGGSGWEENFNLARGMIIARGGPAEMLKSSLPTALAGGVTVSAARLNLEVLAIYETMGCLTTGQEPLLLSDQWESWWFGSSRSTYEEHSVEKQFGMSRKMVALFARLTRLLARVGRAGVGAVEVDIPLAAEAQKMDMDVDAWIESLQVTTLEHERVQVGNRAYAHAMKILLLRNVYSISRRDLRVQAAATEVLQHCSTSTALLGMSIDLTWPTIIAASCVEGQARQWVLTLFEGFKGQCCFDIETAARIVLEVWARVDTGQARDDWKQVCEDLGLRVLLC